MSVFPRETSSEFIFRDIRGSDLEFLDRFFTNTEYSSITLEDIVCVLQKICVNKIPLRKVWKRDILKIWGIIKEEILVNYTDKLTFLRIVCAIQHGRFIGLMEDVPISKLIAMVRIYQSYHEESGQT